MILLKKTLLAFVAGLLCLPGSASAQQPPKKPDAGSAAAAGNIADFFSKMGDQIFEDCIYELSAEQLEVQHALIGAYIRQGASSALARKLAVKQIRPPKLSAECEKVRGMQQKSAAKQPAADALPWDPKPAPPPAAVPAPPAGPPKKPAVEMAAKAPEPTAPSPGPGPAASGAPLAPGAVLTQKQVLPQWDCAPGVDYVTITHKGYPRKLTGGEICNPFEDVVRELPATASGFRLGYTIRTGRVFVISDDPKIGGKTIAWAISGREACRNNPDPDCFAARAIGPLPPGEYTFASDKGQRVSWGPKTKRAVAGIYLTKLWNRERFSPAQTNAILARGNIAIHVRLKGEMSEACLGLEPKGWAYVASLIKDQRATGVNVYIEEPYPQIAENPPVVVASTFSLTSLFK
ncbi:MAG: DUF2778 domain-containing protein [Hyphomicrobiaceae bacterium]|nr:DUF2778 domain-containing protein [Hyphomicrobiaceae bacterium]